MKRIILLATATLLFTWAISAQCDATYSYSVMDVCSGVAPAFTINTGCVEPGPGPGGPTPHLDLDWYIYAPGGVPGEAPPAYDPLNGLTFDNTFPITNTDLSGGNDGLGGTWNGFICADLTVGAALTVTNNTCSPITVTYYALGWSRLNDTDGDSNGGEYQAAPDCPSLRFDVVVYPAALSVVTTDDGTTCGTPAVELRANDGTVCSSQSGIGTGTAATGACATNTDALNYDFSADAVVTALASSPAACAPSSLTGTVSCSTCTAMCSTIGMACDDNDTCTENDVFADDGTGNGTCVCAGTAIDFSAIDFMEMGGDCTEPPQITLPPGYTCAYTYAVASGTAHVDGTGPVATYSGAGVNGDEGMVTFTVTRTGCGTVLPPIVISYSCYMCIPSNGAWE